MHTAQGKGGIAGKPLARVNAAVGTNGEVAAQAIPEGADPAVSSSNAAAERIQCTDAHPVGMSQVAVEHLHQQVAVLI